MYLRAVVLMCALTAKSAILEAQVLPAGKPMANAPAVTGSWRLAGADTGMLASLEMSIVETGVPSGDAGGRHASGNWSALNQGCPLRPECQFRGAVVGSSGGGLALLKLVPAVPGGIGWTITAMRVAADTLSAILSLTSGAQELNRSNVLLVRSKQ